MISNKNWWSDYHIQKDKFKSTPSEHIIRIVKSNINVINGINVLEIGFGDGAELQYFAEHDCSCYGIEATGILCKEFDKKVNFKLKKKIKTGIIEDFPINKINYFDLVYSLETLHYLKSKKEIVDYLNTLSINIKNNAYLFFSLVHPEHFFCKVSERIDYERKMFNNKYKQREGLKFILFENENDIYNVFSNFIKNPNIGYYDWRYSDEKRRCFWTISGHFKK